MSEELTPWPPEGFAEPPGGFRDVFPRAALEGEARDAARNRWEGLVAMLAGEEAVPVRGWPHGPGPITRESVEQFFDDLWAAGRLPQPPSLWPDDGEALAPVGGESRCGALLFPLPSPVRMVAETGLAVFTADFSEGAPAQGPQPVACLLDKDHRISWHWNKGTWWT